MTEVSIYTLSASSDPNNIRYVGKTVDPVNRRAVHKYKASCDKCRGRKLPVYNWIRKLRKNGDSFVFSVIAKVTDDSWEEAEKFYIKYYRDLGHKLLNIEDGGNAYKIRPHYVRRGSNSKKKVMMLDRNTKEHLATFDSVVDASKALGRSRHNIASAARGLRPTAFGYRWVYINSKTF